MIHSVCISDLKRARTRLDAAIVNIEMAIRRRGDMFLIRGHAPYNLISMIGMKYDKLDAIIHKMEKNGNLWYFGWMAGAR